MRVPGETVQARLVRRVARCLRERAERIATAESCTGGLLAKCLTDLPGSSDYFDRGWVTYSNAAKQELLGVGERTLNRHGAVSRAVAVAMARGAFSASRATVAVAITGIAGPTGAMPGKPVGTVWIAWGRRVRGGPRIRARRFRFDGDREAIRRRAATSALQGLLAP